MSSLSNLPPRRLGRAAAPLGWLGPAIALIGFAVLWPVYEMFRISFQHYSPDGFLLGSAGFRNYTKLFQDPNFGPIMLRSLLWVGAVVGLTMLVSLGVAQLFNQRFPGRRVARWALIAPWAASVMMTAIIFRWMLDPNTGALNLLLRDLGLLSKLGTSQADWLGRPDAAFAWMIAVAVFVSVPFSTYTILAGLQTVPAEVYEAAEIDGASPSRTYLAVTLPLLRPAILVATLINVMNVFNSFPIIWEMTRGGPGYETNTSTVYMFNLKQNFIGQSASMSVVNFAVIVAMVLVFLRVSNWKKEVA
ncbi:sugar ABC transporter permease [Actinocrinis puniceicyclus]|uniref:Sugar ABC transporter permease n=1 Tax=Actinocrinis puniceicyclus TaxID=977794 RepID=A0A8J8BF48_9ACTN|nr:sugar ABC transporter permease [Actinocrinis puniceicyclus]MBS2965811.1 sugar ABC transporter permease [Actinocrinis puniceicyclus]